MGIFGGTQDKKIQLYFGDDQSFQFIKRPLKYSCLVEMDGDKMKRAWKHFYNTELPFPGYKSISAGLVTLGFPRDIILDPFDKIPKGTEMNKKPNLESAAGLKDWISKIAENMRHIYRAKRTTSTSVDVITWVLIGILVAECLGWLIKFTTG